MFALKRRIAALAGTALTVAVAVNAQIVQHGRCGTAGSFVYVQNNLADKPVKATISAVRRTGDTEKSSQRIVRVPPGGEVRLGCSVGSNDLKNIFEVISTDPS